MAPKTKYKTVSGRINYLISSAQAGSNFSKLLIANTALHDCKLRLDFALAASNQAFYEINVRFSLMRLSPELTLMMGYNSEDCMLSIDYLTEQIHPDDRIRISNAYASFVSGDASSFKEEYRHRTRTEGWKWVLSQGKVVERDDEGSALYIIGTVTDISGRKKIEGQLRNTLLEKTALLKELHHRVNNNLEVICALLELQSDNIPAAQFRVYFSRSQDRIRSMAMVHKQLYRSQDFASIDFTEYVSSLATDLLSSYEKDTDRIKLSVVSDNVLLGIDQSIPCGLILNELISNCLKHAFDDSKKGEIRIRLSLDCYNMITITIADNGVGFIDNNILSSKQTLGLEIVRILIKQLKGRLIIGNDIIGTIASITFQKS